jgi:hypothetical protein
LKHLVKRLAPLLAALLLALPVAASGHPLDVTDVDHDQRINPQDNCPERYNPKQEDTDADSVKVEGPDGTAVYAPPGTPASPPATTGGDKCDTDDDNDTKLDTVDNCDKIANPGQEDLDLDGEGDPCDLDDDGDERFDEEDNCPLAANPGQGDSDRDGLGDVCDPDAPKGDPAGALGGFDPNDKTAPAAALELRRSMRLEAVRAGIVVPLTCSEGCVANASLRAGKRTLGGGAAVIHAAGRTYVFVRYAKGAGAALRKARRTRAILELRVVDASGNAATLSRRITLKR